MRFLKNLGSKGFAQEILLFKDQKLGISPLDPKGTKFSPPEVQEDALVELVEEPGQPP
jgi:hypothetical protein